MERFSAAVREVQKAWPAIDVDPEVFESHVRERIDPELDAVEAIDALDLDGLYLAFGAGHGAEAAIEAIEKSYFGDLRRAISKLGAQGAHADEIEQRLRDKLFVAADDKPPKILTYNGRGELGRWLRVVATREALAILRKGKRETLTDDNALIDAVTPSRDHELDYLKSHYRKEFKAAFHHALEELEPRQRTILRYQLVDGLNIDEIGAVYGVHRATAARWVEKIRTTLLKRTRNRLMEEIRVGTDELDSIMRLISSQLDVSIHRILTEDGEA
jgi:RNA polymerase sigma-70 factor (ECF subfamily)